MASYQQKVVFSILRNPKEVYALMPVKAWTASRRGKKQAERASVLLPGSLYRLTADGVTLVKGGSAHLKDPAERWVFSLQMI